MATDRTTSSDAVLHREVGLLATTVREALNRLGVDTTRHVGGLGTADHDLTHAELRDGLIEVLDESQTTVRFVTTRELPSAEAGSA